LFFEMRVDTNVQLSRARQIVTEWLLDDDAPPPLAFRQTRAPQTFGDLPVLARLRRKIKQNVAGGLAVVLGFLQRRRDLLVRSRLPDIARQVEQTLRERPPEVFIEWRVFEEFRDRILHARPEIVIRHRGS